MKRTFAIYNFGCKVNQEEGGAIAALFSADGWQKVEDKPGLIIINTCTVTAIADKKARNLIRRLRKDNADALIVACGCYPQRDADEIKKLGVVDIITGVDERRNLPKLVSEYLLNRSSDALISVGEIQEVKDFHRIAETNMQKRTRAYLKIEDGCDQFCNYCIIPYVRGPVRSLSLAEVVEQAKRLVDMGHEEIVLSGIHIGAYGSDLRKDQSLVALIQELIEIKGLLRLRLGSIEPQQFTDDLIEIYAAEPRICAHLHIPLQSGSDRILTAMGRRYSTQDYAQLIKRLCFLRADTAITADVIVGYPGETDEDFIETVEFIKTIDLAAMHIFPYSKRSGTPAADLPWQLSRATKSERAIQLNEIAKQKSTAFMERFIGQELDLLAEEIVNIDNQTYLSGHSSNYIRLLLPWSGEQIPKGLIEVHGASLEKESIIVTKEK